MRFVKDVLYPGTYRLADGRRVTYTPDDVKRMASRVKEMVREGLQIPACWDHQTDAKPDRLAMRAKFNLGFVEDAEVTPEGYLSLVMDVPGEEDASRLPSVRFVSPEIVRDFVDGSGKKWDGPSITHIAVTPRPVQHKQQAFQPVRMSLDIVRLSLGDYEMAEEMKDEGSENKGGEIKELIEALRGAGINVPDEVQDIPGLIIAVKASSGQDGDTMDTPEEPDEEPIEEASSPVIMSLTRKLVDMEREKLERRIKDLHSNGKVSRPVRDKLLADLKTERLSLTKTGDLGHSKLVSRVEAYEELEGVAFKGRRDRLGHGEIREAERPTEYNRNGQPSSPEEVEQAVNAFKETVGR